MKHPNRKHGRLLLLLILIVLPVLLSVACTRDPADSSTTADTPILTDPAIAESASDEPIHTNPADTEPDQTNSEDTKPTDTLPADSESADTDSENPSIGAPLMRDNITLNAYLIPMMTQELREEMMQLCKDADIDVLSHVYPSRPWVAERHTFEWYKTAMADADRYGLKLLTREKDVMDALRKSDDELRAIAEKYKDLPGFGGFFIIDEPYNPSPYAHAENIFREVCPDAYINVNFLPQGAYPSEEVYLRQLCDYGGLLTYGGTLSLDVYCFNEQGSVSEMPLFRNYDLLREAGLRTGNDTAVYVQSVGLAGGYRRPSGADLRYNMMAALAYGIKEIKFFTWGTPTADEGNYTEAIIGRDNKPTDLYYEVCKINKKIHAIGSHLASCDATLVYHSQNKTNGAYDVLPKDYFVQAGTANVILSMLEERNGDGEYIFVVNKDFNAEQTVTLLFTGLSSVSLVSDGNGELTETALTDGALTLTLAAGDGILLKLPAGDFIKTEKESHQNLALHAPVFGTSSDGSANYYLYNLTDGIVDSVTAARVSDKEGKEQLLTVDLGGVQTINRIDLYPAGVDHLCGAFNPTDFSLLVSADGESWVEVVKNSDVLPRDFVSVFRFTDIEARYVRICIRGLQGISGRADIGELMVYKDDGNIPDKIATTYTTDLTESQNLALNKPVVDYSSTTDVPEWTCHHTYITDGKDTTAWASELFRNDSPDAPEWITIDLLEVYEVNRVVLVPRSMWNGTNVYPEKYEIQVSVDGVTFTTVEMVEDNLGTASTENRVINFEPTTARYIRLYATRLSASSTVNGGYAIEMSELEVFGQVHEQIQTS